MDLLSLSAPLHLCGFFLAGNYLHEYYLNGLPKNPTAISAVMPNTMINR